MLGDVYSSLGTAARANVLLVAVAIACSALAFASTWALQRVTLRMDRWSDVAGPQLSGNAASNLLPAGSAFGLLIQLRMLRRRGVDLTRAVTSLTIAGLLSTIAGLCAVPVLLVLPLGDNADTPYAKTAYTAMDAALVAAASIASDLGIRVPAPALPSNRCYPMVAPDRALLIETHWAVEEDAAGAIHVRVSGRHDDRARVSYARLRRQWETHTVSALFGP